MVRPHELFLGRDAITAAHFKRMQDPPNVKKWLAYERKLTKGSPRRPKRVARTRAVAEKLKSEAALTPSPGAMSKVKDSPPWCVRVVPPRQRAMTKLPAKSGLDPYCSDQDVTL